MLPLACKVETAVKKLGETAMHLGNRVMSPQYKEAFAHASPFLNTMGDISMAWMLLWRAVIAQTQLNKHVVHLTIEEQKSKMEKNNMNFDLTKEQKMIQKEVRRFAKTEIAPRVAEFDEKGEYPYEIIEKMGKLGFMGIPFPEEYGGMGGDWVGMHLCIEEISHVDGTLGAMLDITTSVIGQELLVFGTEEQKQKFLIPIAKGEKIGAFGMTESDAGSDAGGIVTTASLEGDEWVINGTKQFITNIGLENASIVVATAKTVLENGKEKICTYIVPKDAPGFSLGKRYKKMAWASSATHEVILNNCRIPKENILGDPGRGLAQHLEVLETGRISIAAVATGVAQACLEAALRHSKNRRQFGTSIFKFQGIQFKLANMAMNIELARNQYLKAAWLKDNGRAHTFEATVAKLFASEMLEKVASDALQIHGGYGYMDEYPISRMYKGAKILQIVEGTSEVLRMILGAILYKAKF
ncbi:MAG: acyl-CoA dehydrogenase family protein [Desulfobacterium sp.]